MNIKLFILFFILIFSIHFNIYSQDSLKKDKIKPDSGTVNEVSKVLKIEIVNKEKIFNVFSVSDVINVISSIILLSSLIFAYSSIRSNIINNNKQIQNYNTFELYKSLLEINKLSMQYPELWGYLDDYDHLILDDNNEIDHKKDARVTEFINYQISLYNRAHGFYVIDKNKDVSVYFSNIWSSWVNYMKDTIKQSSRMKNYIESCDFDEFYNKDFVGFIRSLILKK